MGYDARATREADERACKRRTKSTRPPTARPVTARSRACLPKNTTTITTTATITARSRRPPQRRRPAAGDAGARLLEVDARARGQGALAARAAHQGVRAAAPIRRPIDPMSRRNFFQLMGASDGLAGLAAGAGCRRYEKEEIVPLARRPEDQIPGQTLQYATTFDLGGVGARARRDVVRGSSDPARRQPRAPVRRRRHRARHEAPRRPLDVRAGVDPPPLRSGSLAAPAQQGPAARRSRRSRPRSASISKMIDSGGAACSARRSSSPTRRRAPRAASSRPGVGWHEYEPISWDNERVGTKHGVRPRGAPDRAARQVRDDRHDRLRHRSSSTRPR